MTDVDRGAAVIGDSDLFQADKGINGLWDHQVAVEAFTLVVSPDIASQVENLTTAQIQEIYAGSITNWGQIGGPNEVITAISLPTTSDMRAIFDKYVLKGGAGASGTTLSQATTRQS